MGTEAAHKSKSRAKSNLNLAILAWGVLSIISVIGYLMERFPHNGNKNIIFLGLSLLGIVLLVDFILHIRGFILGITTVIQNKAEDDDHIVMRAAIIGAALGFTGAVISFFLFIGW
jgi:hypothetical protein